MKPLIVAFALLVCGIQMVQPQPTDTSPVADSPSKTAPLAEQDGLKISIAPSYQSESEQSIGVHRADPHINVVLQNTSDKPIQLFQEWNSWGFYNLTLEVTAVDGKVLDKPIRVYRGGMAWLANVPSVDIIGAGGAIVREVRLYLPPQIFEPTTPLTDKDLNPFGRLYFGFPFPPADNSRTLTMRAVFTNDNAKGDKAILWTGRIASVAKSYRMFWDSK